jgi:hypothetical protein
MKTLITGMAVVVLVAACGNDPTRSGFNDADAAPGTGSLDAGGSPVGDAADERSPFPASDASDANDVDGGCHHLNVAIVGDPGLKPSSNFQQWLVSAGTSAQRIQQNASEAFTDATLAPFDVIVLNHLGRAYTTTEAAALRAWVEAGGGLVSTGGYTNDATDFRVNAFIGPLGVIYAGSLVNGPVTTFLPHPITAGLTSITFAGGYAVIATGLSSYTVTAIASMAAGKVAYAVEASKGRAFIWGDEWIEYDSEWADLPEVKQLWINAFKWLVPRGCELTPPP